jgi:hypothetical protein
VPQPVASNFSWVGVGLFSFIGRISGRSDVIPGILTLGGRKMVYNPVVTSKSGHISVTFACPSSLLSLFY